MSPSKTRVGVIGYGYWGPNLVRNFVANLKCEVVGVVDADPGARARCAALYPHVPVYAEVGELLKRARPDGIAIATPPESHCALAIQCLEAGCDVLIEKPMAMSVEECDRILAAGERVGRGVMVDHTFMYHPAVELLEKRVRDGDLGDLLYYDSVRVNFGGFQAGADVLWDLAPHDLSILDVLTRGKVPQTVSAVGVKHFDQAVANQCYLSLAYKGDFIAHVHLNWTAPVKLRTVMVAGTKKMAIYDDNLPAEKVKIYDREVSLQPREAMDFRVSYRTGDMTAPAFFHREALEGVVSAFLRMIAEGVPPKSDGESGRRMLQILEAATLSMHQGGVHKSTASTSAPAARKRAA